MLFLISFFLVVVKADRYLDEVEGQCYSTNSTYPCTKYKIAKYIDSFDLNDVNLTSDSSVRFVDVPAANFSDLFPEARSYSNMESEFGKVVKFLQRKAERFLSVQGLSVDLPEEVRIVDNDQGRGKGGGGKKSIIFPIIILVKLFKIKILVTLILGAVLFIKKILLFAGFILPGVVASIKHHCKAQQVQVVPHYIEESHYPDEEDEIGISGYGGGGGSSDKHHYWDRKNRRKYIIH